jgi:uncharacterized protein (DUF4415 family)
MNVDEFITRWTAREGGAERANYQMFLSELCDVIGVPHPDPAGAERELNDYVFERGVIPELDDAWFAKAEIHVGGEPVKRGRPPLKSPKKAVSLRLSQKVLHGFQEEGPGWQTRINDALEDWLDKQGK